MRGMGGGGDLNWDSGDFVGDSWDLVLVVGGIGLLFG